MTDGSVSQAGLAVVAGVEPEALVSQVALAVVGSVIPAARVSQAGAIVLATSAPCLGGRTYCWIITRRDGEVFRFTSLDRDFTWGDDVYSACRSLQESASEQTLEMGHAGNLELQGIIDADGLSAEDLHAGLFDDAFVEVWRVSWRDRTEIPYRMAAGNLGAVSHGEGGFSAEVLGPGARLQQKPLLQTVTPGCRWTFGSTQCGVDREALAISGEVTAVSSRAYFVGDQVDPGGDAQWDRGVVRWTSGNNAGQECEVMSVDFDTGAIVLWSPPGFLPEAGDDFDLLPGCDFAFEGGCTAYANTINFGGFKDVPGSDAVKRRPNAKA